MSGKRGSRYARLAGTAWRHRVTGALSPCAWSLWTRCLSYCPDEETDGVIPRAMLRAIAGGATSDRELKAGLAECLKAGVLREREDRDYEVAGYADHNITRGEDERRRAEAARRQAESRSRALVTPDVTRDKRPDKTVSHTTSHASVTVLSLTQDSGLRTQDSDRIGSLSSQTLPGVPGARGAPTTSEPTPHESDDVKARTALAAYLAAEQAAGSVCEWTTGAAYGQLVTVHRLAEAQAGRTGQSVADVLAAWARRYVAERQRRHPKWWLDLVNDWLAAPAKSAPTTERRGSLPVATREDLLADVAPEGLR